jgi:CDP-diacylglycerol---glycerol-3-phosphate 3-phosphatidyltransferase
MASLLPNILSLLRFPLAFLFLQENPLYRCLAIFLAMISDGLDGFLARKYKQTSRLGATLDPLADKFFVLFALFIFLREERLTILNATVMLSRDISVALFGLYLFLTNKLPLYQFRSIWAGKLTTFFQFIFLFSLTCGVVFSDYLYTLFAFFGIWAFIELYSSRQRLQVND